MAFCPAEEEEEKLLHQGKVSTIVLEDDGDDALDAPEVVAELVVAQKGKRKALPYERKTLKAPKVPKAPKGLMTMHSSPVVATVTDATLETTPPSTTDLDMMENPYQLNSILQTSELRRQSKKPAIVIGAGTSSIDNPVNVLIDKTSIFELMEAGLAHPLMMKMHDFVQKVGEGRGTRVHIASCPHGGFELLIADIPEGLPVPRVSFPTTAVLEWNIYIEAHLKAIFEFAYAYLHHDAAMLIFMPESQAIRTDVRTYASTKEFKIFKDWWGINELRMTSPVTPKSLIPRFRILLFLRDIQPPPQFAFQEDRHVSYVGYHVEEDDILFNFTMAETQLMNGVVPWRGPREKDPAFLQILVEALTKPSAIIIDDTASTGASIHACRRYGRHLVAFKADNLIFEGVLASLRDAPPPPDVVIHAVETIVLEDDDIPIRRVAKKNRLNNFCGVPSSHASSSLLYRGCGTGHGSTTISDFLDGKARL